MAGRRYANSPLRDPETGQWDRRELQHRLKGWLAVLVSVAVLAAGGAFVAQRGYSMWLDYRAADDYLGPGVEDIEVVIPKGATISKIAQILKDKDVVKTTEAFTDAAQMRPDEAKRIQAGKYRMQTQIPGSQALDTLLDPKAIVRNFIQFREGLRLSAQLEQLAKSTKIPLKDFEKAAKDADALGVPSWAKGDVEGFLFPDTYELPDKPTAKGILSTAVDQFNQVAKDLDLVNGAEAVGRSPYEIVVVASIMEREVFRDEDRPKVARVIYNRLAEGMPLQLDSTVAYAANKTGTIWTTAEERERNTSPYNTYKYKGLPPGPISSPARKALDAALNPDDGDWLFFMPQNLDTGETVFTATKAEHDAAVAKFQQWCTATPENREKCQ